MLYQSKSLGEWISGLACIAVLALSMAVVGCGGNEGAANEEVAVRTTKESKATQAVTQPLPPGIEAAPLSSEAEDAVVSVPEPPKEVTFEEAEAAFHEKRYEEAMELFTLYTARESKNPWGYYMLGLSAWKAGDHESAEEAFTQALELDQLHVKSWLNLSRVLLDMGRPKEALAKIDEALSIDPGSNIAYRLRGRAFHELEQQEEALSAYRQALQIDDHDAWSMNNMALIFIEGGLFAKALPALARAVELRSDVAFFFNNLGMALECTGHFRAAEEAYQSAITIDESCENASANLARVEAVFEDPGIEPVDLGTIAQSFVDEIESWSGAVVASEQAGPAEPDTDTIVISDTDSTDNSQEK